MRIERSQSPQGALFLLYKEQTLIGRAAMSDGHIGEFFIDPAWRRRGYGSYLLRRLLHEAGGYRNDVGSCFTAPLPADEGALAFAAKFGFVPGAGCLCRRRTPELTAVGLVHQALRSRLAPGGFYLDATCGNGHDTLFLCRLAGQGGRVLGLDVQPQAVQATNQRIARAGLQEVGRAVVADHRDLLRYAPPGSADCVLFNFGWLPGGDHALRSQAESSVAALRAGLQALRPGGVLAAVLYSGRETGFEEKQAALACLRSLPIGQYTTLVCQFGNWAETAPLPCLVFKKEISSASPPADDKPVQDGENMV